MQEQQDRFQSEKQRQAELTLLRREKRQAEIEDRFESAALVMGLAERNRQNLEERYLTANSSKLVFLIMEISWPNVLMVGQVLAVRAIAIVI